METDFEIKDQPPEKRYEATIEDTMVRIEYIKAQDRIYLTHTEVPQALEGNGICSKLVAKVLREIDRQQCTVVPLCPFVTLYLKRHPDWKRLVMKGINIT